jgi:tetratricopeptide (TPR) repeat protein
VGGEHLLLDPEVEYLLREIAADPRSSLLRVSRPASLTPFLERSAPVSPNAAGLTSAERHLLLVYRLEIVQLLRFACLIRFYSDSTRSIYIHNSITVEQSITVPDPTQWNMHCSAVLSTPSAVVDAGATQLLQQCIQDKSLKGISIATIAAAALRLEPCDAIRIYAGFDLAQRGHLQSAWQVLRDVVAGPANSLDASYAWEDLAFVHSQLYQYDKAAQAARKAARLGPERAEPFMNWFFNACMAGLENEAYAAAVGIEQAVAENHPTVEMFVMQIGRQRERGDWTATQECRTLIAGLRDKLSAASRRIADVIS